MPPPTIKGEEAFHRPQPPAEETDLKRFRCLCGLCHVRTGAIIIGLLEFLFVAHCLIFVCSNLSNGDHRYQQINPTFAAVIRFEYLIPVLVILSIWILTIFLLLLGIKANYPILTLPHMALQISSILLGLTMTVMFIINMRNYTIEHAITPSLGITVGVLFAFTLIEVYFSIVSYQCYKYLIVLRETINARNRLKPTYKRSNNGVFFKNGTVTPAAPNGGLLAMGNGQMNGSTPPQVENGVNNPAFILDDRPLTGSTVSQITPAPPPAIQPNPPTVAKLPPLPQGKGIIGNQTFANLSSTNLQQAAAITPLQSVPLKRASLGSGTTLRSLKVAPLAPLAPIPEVNVIPASVAPSMSSMQKASEIVVQPELTAEAMRQIDQNQSIIDQQHMNQTQPIMDQQQIDKNQSIIDLRQSNEDQLVIDQKQIDQNQSNQQQIDPNQSINDPLKPSYADQPGTVPESEEPDPVKPAILDNDDDNQSMPPISKVEDWLKNGTSFDEPDLAPIPENGETFALVPLETETPYIVEIPGQETKSESTSRKNPEENQRPDLNETSFGNEIFAEISNDNKPGSVPENLELEKQETIYDTLDFLGNVPYSEETKRSLGLDEKDSKKDSNEDKVENPEKIDQEALLDVFGNVQKDQNESLGSPKKQSTSEQSNAAKQQSGSDHKTETGSAKEQSKESSQKDQTEKSIKSEQNLAAGSSMQLRDSQRSTEQSLHKSASQRSEKSKLEQDSQKSDIHSVSSSLHDHLQNAEAMDDMFQKSSKQPSLSVVNEESDHDDSSGLNF